MKHLFDRALAFLLVASLLLLPAANLVVAEQNLSTNSVDNSIAKQASPSLPSCEEYRQAEQVTDYAGEPIRVEAGTFLAADSTAVKEISTLDGQDAVLTGEAGRIVWEVNVPVDGRYTVTVIYYPIEGYGGNIEQSSGGRCTFCG